MGRAWTSAPSPFVVLSALLLLVGALPAGLTAQTPPASRVSVHGLLVDPAGVRVDGATVRLVRRGVQAVTDSVGRFRLVPVAPGEDTLFVRRFGLLPLRLPITLAAEDTAELVLIADRAPAMVEALEIRETPLPSRVAEFNRRATAPTARASRFLTREQLARLPAALDATDALRRFPTLQFVEVGAGGDPIITIRRGGGSLGTQCVPEVWMDGVHVGDAAEAMPFLRSLQPGDLEGIEVYAGGASLPPEYNRGCGAILVWTRR